MIFAVGMQGGKERKRTQPKIGVWKKKKSLMKQNNNNYL
jgi:hypothetical protein